MEAVDIEMMRSCINDFKEPASGVSLITVQQPILKGIYAYRGNTVILVHLFN